MGKSVRMPGKSPNEFLSKETTQPAERIYTDVVGPMKKELLGRSRYFVAMFGEHSGFSFVRFINRKS